MKNNKSIDEILNEPYILNILLHCDGKNSISDISEKLALTYKTTFKKIKSLENYKIIKVYFSGIIGDKSIITVNNDYPLINKVNMELERFKLSSDLLLNQLKDETSVKITKELLKTLSEKRFLKSSEILSGDLESVKIKSLVYAHLIETGYIRERIEITKKGKTLINSLDKTLS